MKPDLSVIIPTLNESEALPLLLADLVSQQNITFEVIIADGGSTDATCQVVEDLFRAGKLTGFCLIGARGRGRQLNAGALQASADWLLFLHADSRLNAPDQLSKALAFMRSCRRKEGTNALAGRFSLRFDSTAGSQSFGLFYYETKATLGRPGSIHGDQGMLLDRTFFNQVGPFREDLPVMEDTSFAESVRNNGQWLLLPGDIVTSSRRFQVEGMKPRQTLNALMMNFMSIGWLEFFEKAPDVYRQQDRSRPLQLLPFFLLIKKLLSGMSFRERLRIWLATGSYVRSQAWQIGLAMDCRKAYRLGLKLDYHSLPWLERFDLWFEPMTNHSLGRSITALLVKAWFTFQLYGKPEPDVNKEF